MAARTGRPYKLQVLSTNGERKLQGSANNPTATSRFIPDITEEFKGSPSLEIRANDGDVRKYLDGHMSRLRPFVSRKPDLQEEIKTQIVKAVDGM